jgi:hypothetical protein
MGMNTRSVPALAIAVLVGSSLVACSARPAPSGSPDRPGPTASGSVSVPSAPPTGAPPGSPLAPPTGAPGTPASFPVRAGELGVSGRPDAIDLDTGLDGDLYVAVEADQGVVLGRIDAAGKPRPGWPILLPSTGECGRPLSAEDGSVRIICRTDDDQGNIAFAFDADARALSGWPVRFPGELQFWEHRRQPRVEDGRMTVISLEPIEEGENGDTMILNTRLVSIDASGTVDAAELITFSCCYSTPRLGPDGIGWMVESFGLNDRIVSRLTAFDGGGIRAGWPIEFEGDASLPAFAGDRAIVVVGSEDDAVSRTLVFDADGHELAGSAELPIRSTSEWQGAGEEIAPPLATADGSAWVVSTGTATTVYRLDPAGHVVSGWPYRSEQPLEALGSCGNNGDTGCGYWLTRPALGPDGTLYLLHPAAPGAGGIITAVGPDGRVVDGWPVTLQRAGSSFQAVVVGPDGTIWATASEPEADGLSVTLVALEPDSSVRYKLTVAEP